MRPVPASTPRGVICLAAVSVAVLATLAFAPAYGLSSTLSLDPIPDRTYAGDKIVFTGTLTGGGYALPDRVVWICEDDPFIPDECLAYGITNRFGEYQIQWTAEAGVVEVDFDIYAEFDGDRWYDGDQTPRHTMSVYKRGGSITLDPIPARAAYGEVVTFTGTLKLDGYNPEGSVVYIKDEDALNPDDLLVSAYVEASGRFTTIWMVEDVDPDYTIDIQAVYEGGSLHHRQATPIYGLAAYYGTPEPEPEPGPAGDGYMELYRSLDFDQAPRVAIVPSPDSFEEVRRHIIPVQEGIRGLTAMLESAYPAGDWNVDFEVVEPGGVFDARPDVIMNLVTRDDDSDCDWDGYSGTWGWAFTTHPKPVPTTVCSYDDLTNTQVGETAVHEFVHAIGLGHTFNIPGDLMCSVEDGKPTCPGGTGYKSVTPSDLNLAALVAIYGTDGFTNPNNDITRDETFALNGYQRVGPATSPLGQDVAGETVRASAVMVYMLEGALFPACADSNDCFVPHTVTVGAGADVTWTNSDIVLHTVTEPGGLFDSWLLPGEEFTFTFETPGTYMYGCAVHPWASGVVVVDPDMAAPGPEQHESAPAEHESTSSILAKNAVEMMIGMYMENGVAAFEEINSSTEPDAEVVGFVVDAASYTIAAHASAPIFIGFPVEPLLQAAYIPLDVMLQIIEEGDDGVWMSYPLPDPQGNIIGYERGWFKMYDGYIFAARYGVTDEERVQSIVVEMIRVYGHDPKGAFETINSFESQDPRYPFVVDPETLKVVAHGANPARVGDTSVVLTYSTVSLEEFRSLGGDEGVWTEYVFFNPATGLEFSKRSWVVMHDGYLFGSGYYP